MNQLDLSDENYPLVPGNLDDEIDAQQSHLNKVIRVFV
jgi:hypothetical protein